MAPGGSPAIPPTAVSSERRSQSNQPLNPLGGAPVDLWITLRVAHNPTGPSTTEADIFTCYRQRCRHIRYLKRQGIALLRVDGLGLFPDLDFRPMSGLRRCFLTRLGLCIRP